MNLESIHFFFNTTFHSFIGFKMRDYNARVLSELILREKEVILGDKAAYFLCLSFLLNLKHSSKSVSHDSNQEIEQSNAKEYCADEEDAPVKHGQVVVVETVVT